jgi:hypothetical protein
MARVKGTGWKGIYEYLIKTNGTEGFERLLAALSPEDRDLFSKGILPVSWIDYGTFVRVLLTADKVLGKGDKSWLKAAETYSAWHDLRGIYRAFISLTSPEFVLGNIGRFWGQYFDEGQLTIAWRGEKSGALKLVNVSHMPLYHEYDHIPYMEEAFRMTQRGKNIRGTHPKCLARGDDHCLYEFHWE